MTTDTKTLLLFSFLAFSLAACHQSPEEKRAQSVAQMKAALPKYNEYTNQLVGQGEPSATLEIW